MKAYRAYHALLRGALRVSAVLLTATAAALIGGHPPIAGFLLIADAAVMVFLYETPEARNALSLKFRVAEISQNLAMVILGTWAVLGGPVPWIVGAGATTIAIGLALSAGIFANMSTAEHYEWYLTKGLLEPVN